MKKVLITSTYFWPYLSGLTLYPERLAKLWQKDGHEISVLCFQHDPKLPLHETYSNIKITRVPPHLRISKGIINFVYLIHAYREVKKNDVIIVNIPSLENFWVSLIAKMLGKKAIVLYHCDVDMKNNWFMRIISGITNWSSSVSCFLADRIINSSKDYAQTSPVLRPYLKKVNYAFPPMEIMKKDALYAKQLRLYYGHHKPVIGFVGRFSSEKNLEVLIAAIEILKTKYPKIKLLCVGPYAFQVAGESKYYLKILQMLHDTEIDYEILGVIEPERLASFFDYIDLLVLPSNTRTEAFGMVQVEAMLNPTPVVVVDRPGIRVPVQLTKMGELFKSNDSVDLAAKMQKVLSNPKKYTKQKAIAEKYFLQQGFRP